MGPTRARLERNLRAAGIARYVKVIAVRAADVPWDRPLALLVVDGLHDRASVASDFGHFDPWLARGGLAAFHGHADYFPGVREVVGEVLAGGGYRLLGQRRSLAVLEKVREGPWRTGLESATPPDAKPRQPAHRGV